MLELTEPARVTDDRQDRPGMNQYLLAMSQELRTPLNAVIGMSGLLLDGELSAKQRHYVKGIHGAGETLATILNDVLDLARMLTGRLLIEPIPFDLRAMVEETARILSVRAEERALTLRVDWRPDLPRQVVGDPGRTRQVLANLIGNAISSTSQGEVVVRVSADGERIGVPMVRFTIEDTGIGLPPERLRKIFDQYIPVDASPYRSFGITGLGLRISAELVRCLGGEIGCESELGSGSRFWFVLPMRYAQGTQAPIENEVAGQGGTVLVIESDPAARARYGEQVELAGWEMHCADDIAGALERLREAAGAGHPFQACVFSDYAVRPIHAEIATRLKADERLASVALVMLTAVGSPGEAKKLWHAGFAAYLRKPVPNEELRDTLTALSRVGTDGRGPALITRHSLAESKSAQPLETEGIDRVLASLTAPATRSALIIGLSGSDQIEITDSLAQVGVAVAPATGIEVAIARLATEPYDYLLFDADHLGEASFQLLTAVREQLGVQTTVPVIGLSSDGELRQRLIESGADEALAKPARRSDVELVVRRWAGRLEGSAESPAPVAEAAPPIMAGPAPETEPAERIDTSMFEVSVEGPTPVENVATWTFAGLAGLRVADPPAAEPAPLAIAIGAPVVDPVPAAAFEPVISLIGEPVEEPGSAEIEPVALLPVAAEPTVPGAPAIELDLPNEEASAILAPEGLVMVEANRKGIEAAPVEGLEGNGIGARSDAAVETVDFTPVGETVMDVPVIEEPVPSIELIELNPPPTESSTVPPAGIPAEPEPIEANGTESSGGEHEEPWLEPLAFTEIPALEPEPESIEGSAADGALEITSNEVLPEPPPAPTAPPEPAAIVSQLPVLSIAMIEQLATGGGFGLQHLVVTFLRETPARIGDLATAVTRGDGSRASHAIAAIRRLADLAGAERLAELSGGTEQAIASGRMDTVGATLGQLERGFLEVRSAIDATAPPSAATGELPAVNPTFLDQLSPDKDGASRLLATRLAETFKADGPARLGDLRHAVERGDLDASQRIAQTMKGMCGLIGAEPMAKLCALIEADARLKRIGQTSRRHLEQLSLELERVVAALQGAGVKAG